MSTETKVWLPKDTKGKLMVSKVKSHENSPDYFGKANLEGKIYKLSAWKGTSEAGNPVLNLSFTEEIKPSATPENDTDNENTAF